MTVPSDAPTNGPLLLSRPLDQSSRGTASTTRHIPPRRNHKPPQPVKKQRLSCVLHPDTAQQRRTMRAYRALFTEAKEWRSVMRKTIFAAAALAMATTPAFAQVNTGSGNGLVAVNVQDVSILNGFLNNAQISALNNVGVPVTVNVPVGIAANVCGVSAAVLGKSGGTNPTCTAKSGSKALAQNVITQVLNQKRGH
jgi:hypothetical protein